MEIADSTIDKWVDKYIKEMEEYAEKTAYLLENDSKVYWSVLESFCEYVYINKEGKFSMHEYEDLYAPKNWDIPCTTLEEMRFILDLMPHHMENVLSLKNAEDFLTSVHEFIVGRYFVELKTYRGQGEICEHLDIKLKTVEASMTKENTKKALCWLSSIIDNGHESKEKTTYTNEEHSQWASVAKRIIENKIE